MPHSTTEPEACANCGAPDIASPEAGWIAGKPSSFKRSPRHRGREMLYLCPSCFKDEMFARGLYEDQLSRSVLHHRVDGLPITRVAVDVSDDATLKLEEAKRLSH
jgi:hypothetical protein